MERKKLFKMVVTNLSKIEEYEKSHLKYAIVV